MKQTILLSYSTINELINEPHTWLCKQLDLKRLTTNAMKEGKEAHRVTQDHVSGKVLDPRLKDITVKFPIVEEVFYDNEGNVIPDERTHFIYKINEEYSIHGYKDADDPGVKFGEFKFSSTPWGLTKFYNLIQWKIYSLSDNYDEVVFITGTRDLQKVAMYTAKVLPIHKEQALEWIQKGIEIIESGNFDYKGEGRSFYCNYLQCPFCGGPRV